MSIDAISSIGSWAYPAPSSGVRETAREGAITRVGDIDFGSPEAAPVDPFGGISGLGRAQEPQASAPGFGEVLAGALRDVVVAEHGAVAKADALARGENDDVHGTMISAKEADISLKLVGAVRNKLLDAFHELWRTNV